MNLNSAHLKNRYFKIKFRGLEFIYMIKKSFIFTKGVNIGILSKNRLGFDNYCYNEENI